MAGRDLEEIVGHISHERPLAALDILAEINRRAGSLDTVADRGRVVPEMDCHGIRNYRELIFAPWRIIYKTTREEVRIMAVLDSRRNVEDLLLKRLTRIS